MAITQKAPQSKNSAQKERRTKGSTREARHSNSEDEEPASYLTFVNFCNLGTLWQALNPITDAFLACQSGQDHYDQMEGSMQTEGDETEDSNTDGSDTEDDEPKVDGQTEDRDQAKVSAHTEGEQTEDGAEAECGDQEEVLLSLKYDKSAYGLVFFDYYDLVDLEGIKQRHEDCFTPIPESFIWYVLISVAEALELCHATAGKTDSKAIAHRNVQPEHILFSWSAASDPRFPRIVLTGFRESFNTTSLPQLWSDFVKLGKSLLVLCLVVGPRPEENGDSQGLSEILFKLFNEDYESSEDFGYSEELQTMIGELVNDMMFPKLDGKYVLRRVNELKAAAEMCEHGGEVIFKGPKANL